MKFIFFALIALVAWAIVKRQWSQPRTRRDDAPPPTQGAAWRDDAPPGEQATSLQARKTLSEPQRRCLAHLQDALPSMVVLVQPRISQLLAGVRGELADKSVDFAICGRDSTPLGAIALDTPDPAVEAALTSAGLRYVLLKSQRLPDHETLKSALGFI